MGQRKMTVPGLSLTSLIWTWQSLSHSPMVVIWGVCVHVESVHELVPTCGACRGQLLTKRPFPHGSPEKRPGAPREVGVEEGGDQRSPNYFTPLGRPGWATPISLVENKGVQGHSWGVLGAMRLYQGEGNLWDSVNTRECVMWSLALGGNLQTQVCTDVYR